MAFQEYDENDAVRYIKQQVPDCLPCKNDDLLLVIDAMFDYFESLDDDAPDEQLTEDAVVKYVEKVHSRDKETTVKLEWIRAIVRAETEYEDSITL